MALLTRDKALTELQFCKQAIRDLKEDRKRCWELRDNQVYYYGPVNGAYINKTQYYQDKINKLKQKYFFTEQV